MKKMDLSQKIIKLEKLHGKCCTYNLSELNLILRKTLLENIFETFKHTYFYTEEDKKCIIAKANRFRLTQNEWQYLQKKIENISFCKDEKIVEKTKITLYHTFEKIKTEIDTQFRYLRVQFIHDYEPNDWYLVIFDSKIKEELAHDIKYYKLELDFSKIWGFLSSDKYSKLSDKMFATAIGIDDDYTMFTDIYSNLPKLKSYEIIQDILQSKEFNTYLKEFYYKFQFEIGEHECEHFSINFQ